MIAQVIFLASLACLAAANGFIAPVHHAPQPYKFGYDVKDAKSEQYRQETGNGAGGVAGSYGYTDFRGVKRQTNYVAGGAGYGGYGLGYGGSLDGGLGYGGYGLGYGRLGLGYGGLGLGYGGLGLGYGRGYGGYGLGYGVLGGLGYGRYGY